MEKKGKIDKTIERWEKIRAKGKWRYCLIYGSFLWGGLMGPLATLFEFIFDNNFSLKWLFIRFGYWLLIGFFIGRWQWKSKEELYQKYKDL
ncbi:MAG: hypothetical protein HXX18_12515 [Bacteroidetes bacterium]|nr:hypothetical protein [Bacteroidota bacterium]